MQFLAFNTEVLWSWKGTKKLEINELWIWEEQELVVKLQPPQDSRDWTSPVFPGLVPDIVVHAFLILNCAVKQAVSYPFYVGDIETEQG